jgi:hypothetical protein
MLRLFQHFGARLARPQTVSRCISNEVQHNYEDLDREKKIKIFELEIDVNLTQLFFKGKLNNRFDVLDSSTRRQESSRNRVREATAMGTNAQSSIEIVSQKILSIPLAVSNESRKQKCEERNEKRGICRTFKSVKRGK